MIVERPKDIVRLMSADNPTQAHIWEQALLAEGIRCMVVGDCLDASFGDIPGLKPELWVHRENVERAKAILHEADMEIEDDDSAPAEMEMSDL
jgi:hypothetical protein